jgi:hypothetical protein
MVVPMIYMELNTGLRKEMCGFTHGTRPVPISRTGLVVESTESQLELVFFKE